MTQHVAIVALLMFTTLARWRSDAVDDCSAEFSKSGHRAKRLVAARTRSGPGKRAVATVEQSKLFGLWPVARFDSVRALAHVVDLTPDQHRGLREESQTPSVHVLPTFGGSHAVR